MQKKVLVYGLFIGFGFFVGLQSCDVNNKNPTVPLPIPTNTITFTPTATPIPSNTPVACNTPSTLTEVNNSSAAIASGFMFVDQFSLPVASDIQAVTVNINSASATGAGNFLQLGIYNDTGSNYPNAILFQSLNHQLTSTGSASYTFNPVSFSLAAGKYWLTLYSSVAYSPAINNGSSALSKLVTGNFPNNFPGGAVAQPAPWSYSLNICTP